MFIRSLFVFRVAVSELLDQAFFLLLRKKTQTVRLVERYRLPRDKAGQVGNEAMMAGTKTALGLPV